MKVLLENLQNSIDVTKNMEKVIEETVAYLGLRGVG
jgi:hypothetical protein